LGAPAIAAFLTWLATKRQVSASTQNQALAALLFLYEHVLHKPVGDVEHVVRAKQPIRLPVVLSREEVAAVLSHLEGTMWIIAMLLYGSGLRLEECLQLRVKDLDFDRNQITVRRGKGQKDRMTMLPAALIEPLRQHLADVRLLHKTDVKEGGERGDGMGLAVRLSSLAHLQRSPPGDRLPLPPCTNQRCRRPSPVLPGDQGSRNVSARIRFVIMPTA